jgi:hypothetical protein
VWMMKLIWGITVSSNFSWTTHINKIKVNLLSSFYYIILHISCFSVYFSHFFPTYFQHLPDIRSKFALQLIDISICTSLEILVRLYRNMLQSSRMIFW